MNIGRMNSPARPSSLSAHGTSASIETASLAACHAAPVLATASLGGDRQSPDAEAPRVTNADVFTISAARFSTLIDYFHLDVCLSRLMPMPVMERMALITIRLRHYVMVPR